MNKNDEKFMKKLFSGSLKNPSGKCPSEEDISALADGVLEEDEKNELMKHISKCSRCYEVYTIVRDLSGEEKTKKLRVFSPVSIAASIFIAVISLILFYKISVSDKIDLVNNIGESAGTVVKPVSAADKGSPEKRIEDKETEEYAGEKSGYTISAPAPGIKERSKKKADGKHGPDDKRSKSSAKITNEDITTVNEIVKKKREKLEFKSEKHPAIKSYKVEEKVSKEGIILRSVLSKNEIRGFSSQGRSRDSIIHPGKPETVEKKKGPGVKRKKGGRAPECYNVEKDSSKITNQNKDYILPLSGVPEIRKMIHLSDLEDFSEGSAGENILVEFEIKKNGTINRICVLSGGEGRIPLIIKALSGWVFSLSGMEHRRFNVDLFLDEKGKFKVLK